MSQSFKCCKIQQQSNGNGKLGKCQFFTASRIKGTTSENRWKYSNKNTRIIRIGETTQYPKHTKNIENISGKHAKHCSLVH